MNSKSLILSILAATLLFSGTSCLNISGKIGLVETASGVNFDESMFITKENIDQLKIIQTYRSPISEALPLISDIESGSLIIVFDNGDILHWKEILGHSIVLMEVGEIAPGGVQISGNLKSIISARWWQDQNQHFSDSTKDVTYADVFLWDLVNGTKQECFGSYCEIDERPDKSLITNVGQYISKTGTWIILYKSTFVVLFDEERTEYRQTVNSMDTDNPLHVGKISMDEYEELIIVGYEEGIVKVQGIMPEQGVLNTYSISFGVEEGRDEVKDVGISYSRRWVYLVRGNLLQIWDTQDPSSTPIEITVNDYVALEFNQSEEFMFLASQTGIDMVDLYNGQAETIISTEGVISFSFDEINSLIVTGLQDGEVQIWGLAR